MNDRKLVSLTFFFLAVLVLVITRYIASLEALVSSNGESLLVHSMYALGFLLTLCLCIVGFSAWPWKEENDS